MENSFKGLFEIEGCLIGGRRPNTISAILNQNGDKFIKYVSKVWKAGNYKLEP